MKPLLLTCCLLLPLQLAAQPINFEQAWKQLESVSDTLKASNAEVNRASALADARDDLNLPSVSLNGSYTHLDDPVELDLLDLNPVAAIHSGQVSVPPAIGAIGAALGNLPTVTQFTEQDIFRASLQALWPIYTGGKISAAQRIEQARVMEKQQAAELTRRKLFTNLVNRYYGVRLSFQVWQTQKQLSETLALHLNHAKKLEQQGQIAKVERLNAAVALANAKVDEGKTMRQYQMAQLALNRMLHASNIKPVSKLFMLHADPALAELTTKTLAQHPALALLSAKETQAQQLVKLEKSDYLPKVFLFGHYNLYEDDSLMSKMEPDWMVGMGVKIPLVSNSGRSEKVKAAKSALLQARYTKAQTKQDLHLLLEQLYRQLNQAKEEVSALNTSLELAQENLRLRELAFTQGLSTSVDSVDAQVKLAAVKTRQLAAHYHYVQAYAQLMSTSGQLEKFISHSLTASSDRNKQ